MLTFFTERVDGGRDLGHTYGVTKLLEFHMIYRTKKEDEQLAIFFLLEIFQFLLSIHRK